jgi:hypothetical protein
MQAAIDLHRPLKVGDTILIQVQKRFIVTGEERRNERLFLTVRDVHACTDEIICVEDLRFRVFTILPKENETPETPES